MKFKGSLNQVIALTLLTFVMIDAMVAPGHAKGTGTTAPPMPVPSFSENGTPRLTAADRSKGRATLEKSPLLFVENRGRGDSQAAYYVQGRDTTIYFTPQGITFALSDKNSLADMREASQSVAARKPLP